MSTFKEIEDLLLESFQVIPQEVTDIDKYKKENINYFEVIIMPDGKIYKAIPSHSGFLEYLFAKSKGMNIIEMQEWARETLPRNILFAWMDYLTEQTGCIAVWIDRIWGKPNSKQLEVLKECQRKEVYQGVIEC